MQSLQQQQHGSNDRICFNFGKELYVYAYRGVKKVNNSHKIHVCVVFLHRAMADCDLHKFNTPWILRFPVYMWTRREKILASMALA